MEMNRVQLSEEQLRTVVAESVKKILAEEMGEGKIGNAIKGLGTFAKLAMSPQSKYYFEDNKKWAKKAWKICDALDDLMNYIGEVGDDEDYESLEQAYNLIQGIAKELETTEF